MSEDTRKVEQIEQDAKSAELSEQDLDNVAGGGSNVISTSRSNVKDNLQVVGGGTPGKSKPSDNNAM